jgi:hypothetical protein
MSLKSTLTELQIPNLQLSFSMCDLVPNKTWLFPLLSSIISVWHLTPSSCLVLLHNFSLYFQPYRKNFDFNAGSSVHKIFARWVWEPAVCCRIPWEITDKNVHHKSPETQPSPAQNWEIAVTVCLLHWLNHLCVHSLCWEGKWTLTSAMEGSCWQWWQLRPS